MIDNNISHLITEAVEWNESEFLDKRLRSWRYFNQECDIPADEGRHSLVAPVVKCKINDIEPPLVRPFLQSRRPIEFIPNSPQEEFEAAKQTDAVNYEWAIRNKGSRLLGDHIRDAAVGRNGIGKVYWEDTSTASLVEFSNMLPEEFATIDPEAVVEVEVDDDGLIFGKFRHVERSGNLKVVGVPLDEFGLDADATSFDDARCVYHRREIYMADVLAMDIPGLDEDTIRKFAGDEEGRFEQEKWERRQQDTWDYETEADEALMRVIFTEAYVRASEDGKSTTLYRVLALGDEHHVVFKEEASRVPFYDICLRYLPHSFWGESLAEILFGDQDAQTVIQREVLDGLHQRNNPRAIFNPMVTETADILNTELASVVRSSDPSNAIRYEQFPDVVTPSLPLVQYLDEWSDRKAGVSRAGMGLSPDVLQSTTREAVAMANQGATASVELMVRNIAIGLTRCFGLIAAVLNENASPEYWVRLRGEYQPVNPQSFRPDLDMEINVGVGTGLPEQKIQVLQGLMAKQEQIYASYGPGNPYVTFGQILNTMEDIAMLGGINQVGRYFNRVSPEVEQQFAAQMAQQQAQQAQAQQPAQPDFAQIEQIKGQVTMMKAQLEEQGKTQRHMLDTRFKINDAAERNDIQRDKMEADEVLKAAEILGKYKIAVDKQAIDAAQARNSAGDNPVGGGAS